MQATTYTSRERRWLLVVAVVGVCALNGVFIYSLVFRPDVLAAALTNPVSFVFMAEALIMTGVLGYLLRKWSVSVLPWGWFVAFALAGGLAFAVPVAVLWKGNVGSYSRIRSNNR